MTSADFRLSFLDPDNYEFPSTSDALEDPNGLLAVGGDLSCGRLLAAYAQGIFPWFSDNQPYLWWSPNPRMVLRPRELHIGRTLRKLANKKRFRITVDRAFSEVVLACATAPRNDEGTWITEEMQEAYGNLHRSGYAHSVEAWEDDALQGGLYGVQIGQVFFGESMFSKLSGASRVAFASMCLQLQEWQFQAVDCQVTTDYLSSFGAQEIDRREFEAILRLAINPVSLEEPFNWQANWNRPEHGL